MGNLVPRDRVRKVCAGSFGFAWAQAVLARREQFDQARLVEHAIPSAPGYQSTVGQLNACFSARARARSRPASKRRPGPARRLCMQEAAVLAHVDVFWVLAILAALTNPAAMTIKSVKIGAGGSQHM